MKNMFYLIALTFVMSCYACELLQLHINVRLELPPIPGHWAATFDISKYKLIYPDANGNLVNTTIDFQSHDVQVELYKSYNSFVLAYPLIDDQNGCLRPAAAIFPLHLKKGSTNTLVLSWEAGFTAQMFERLWQKGVNLSTFNSPRLLAKVYEKAPLDPWNIDADLIVQQLAAFDFSAYDVKCLPSRDAVIEVPAASWFLESPFSPVYTNETENQLYLAGISLGFHKLFQHGGGLCLDIYLTENDCVVVNP